MILLHCFLAFCIEKREYSRRLGSLGILSMLRCTEVECVMLEYFAFVSRSLECAKGASTREEPLSGTELMSAQEMLWNHIIYTGGRPAGLRSPRETWESRAVLVWPGHGVTQNLTSRLI